MEGRVFFTRISDYVKVREIQRKYSCISTPQQNGVAERKNMHIAEVAQTMLNDRKMPAYFWVEAISIDVYIMNNISIQLSMA